MIKKILLAVALALPMVGASAQTATKIGLVDTGAIVQVLPDTQEAQKKVAEASKNYEEEYQRLGEEMKRLMADYQKSEQSNELAAIKERKAKEVQDQQVKLQNFEQTASQDLQRIQQELLAPIFQKIKDACESVGKEGGFSLIQEYNPQTVLYFAAPVQDITPLVKAKLGVK